jgi:ABC-type uncharacterized transport system substrate-binding protein
MINQLSKKAPDGNTLGQSADDKISFHGATPIAQQVLAAGATLPQVIDALTALGLTRKT